MADESGGRDGLTTVIGPDAVFRGDLEVGRGVRVEGRLEGSIRAKGQVVVAGSGRAEAVVDAAGVEIQGQFDGTIHARERAVFGPGCRISGQVSAGAVRIDEGAELSVRMDSGKGFATGPRDHLAAGAARPAPVSATA